MNNLLRISTSLCSILINTFLSFAVQLFYSSLCNNFVMCMSTALFQWLVAASSLTSVSKEPFPLQCTSVFFSSSFSLSLFLLYHAFCASCVPSALSQLCLPLSVPRCLYLCLPRSPYLSQITSPDWEPIGSKYAGWGTSSVTGNERKHSVRACEWVSERERGLMGDGRWHWGQPLEQICSQMTPVYIFVMPCLLL